MYFLKIWLFGLQVAPKFDFTVHLLTTILKDLYISRKTPYSLEDLFPSLWQVQPFEQESRRITLLGALGVLITQTILSLPSLFHASAPGNSELNVLSKFGCEAILRHVQTLLLTARVITNERPARGAWRPYHTVLSYRAF